MAMYPEKERDREAEREGIGSASCSYYSPQGNVRINLLRDYPGYTMFSVLPIVCLFKHN